MLEYILGLFVLLRLYTEINFFLIKRRIKGPAKIMKGAHPFLYKKGKKGIIYIHGFTSSPTEARTFARYMKKRNISFYAPLLSGHGTSPERLSIVKWHQWVTDLEEAIKTFSNTCDNIYLVGNSFGGNLAFIAANNSKKIKGIISLGTPIAFRRERTVKFIFQILKHVKLFQKKIYSTHALKIDIHKRGGGYLTVPLKNVPHMLKIVKQSKKALQHIKKPTLIMQSTTDQAVDSRSVSFIFNKIKSKTKKIIWIPNAYHVLIMDKCKKQVFEETYKFIKNN